MHKRSTYDTNIHTCALPLPHSLPRSVLSYVRCCRPCRRNGSLDFFWTELGLRNAGHRLTVHEKTRLETQFAIVHNARMQVKSFVLFLEHGHANNTWKWVSVIGPRYMLMLIWVIGPPYVLMRIWVIDPPYMLMCLPGCLVPLYETAVGYCGCRN